MQRLFIYGTLGPGGPNEHVMNEIGGAWEAASVKGYLAEKGWGASQGYPGLVISDEGEDIYGHVFRSPNLEQHWDYLDSFEGEEYERRVTTATLEEGTQARTYVYALRSE